MVRIGKNSTLEIVKFTEQGAYLDGGPYGEILLPRRYVNDSMHEEDEIEVFISFDSEDRLYATTEKPLLMVGEFGVLEVVDVTKFGAFLDWGLPKNLFVPFREQAEKMQKGEKYVVYVYVDTKTGRIAATSKINKHIETGTHELQPGDKVDLIIANKTQLGYNAIINGRYSGLIFFNAIFKPIKTGTITQGYVKNIRDDGKIDLSLEKQGYERIDPIANIIIDKLKTNNGVLHLSDKSNPELIKQELGISKKAFKQAIGSLYKRKTIAIENNLIKLIK